MDKIIPNPCKADCPQRSAHCRSTCVKHKVYVALRDKEYAKRAAEREIKRLSYDYNEIQRKRISRYQAKSRPN